MIYTVDNKKYIHGERDVKQTSLSMIKMQKLHLENTFLYHCNLTENDKLFLITAGDIIFIDKRIESGNVIYISKFSEFKLSTNQTADIIEIDFDYSESITFFNKTMRIIKAPLDVQEYFNKIYDNSFFCNHLTGINESLLLNILNTLNLLCDSDSFGLILYQKCREWIEHNITSYITANSVATAMNCTVAHLNRTVKRCSGKCLSTIITERRILKIKQLVIVSNCSTNDIANQLSFETPELLRKYFRYHTGISLKEYRTESLL